ncbi:MAG: hypothetical protein RRZ70_04715 [Synergistaceae bacterium]
MKNVINTILTYISVIMILVWCWRWLGPGSEIRRKELLMTSGYPLIWYLWIGLAVASLGYLLWKFLLFIYWKKYNGDDVKKS